MLLFQWYDGDWSFYLDGGQPGQKQGLQCTFKRNFEEYKNGQNGTKTPKRGVLVIKNVVFGEIYCIVSTSCDDATIELIITYGFVTQQILLFSEDS